MLDQELMRVVISDVKLSDINGIALTTQIKKAYLLTEVIVLTAYGTISDDVAAMKKGAFNYITKGDDNDKIIPFLSRAKPLSI